VWGAGALLYGLLIPHYLYSQLAAADAARVAEAGVRR
jgi:hypothetical protein